MDLSQFRTRIYQSILALSTEQGINASGKDDVYGCIFGRDSAITILKILSACSRGGSSRFLETQQLLAICKRSLLTLVDLQGKETNLESGEEPGKFIHEYRTEKYERLLLLEKPWYIYPDGILRNYDSLDATPLGLIAIYRYWQTTNDNAFLLKVLPAVEAGLNWLITYGDRDKDYLVEYELSSDRLHGGLPVQSWTDSVESLLQEDGKFPFYPIAPVEVQGYVWLALKLWADFYMQETNTFMQTKKFAKKLLQHANALKKQFNALFLLQDKGLFFPAQALDGNKNQIKTITGNPLLLLWAAYQTDLQAEAILENQYVPDLVARSLQEDLFDTDAGLRTMSTTSKTYDAGQNSYHNGSFWPKLNGMAHEGLRNFGYVAEAEKLREATIKPLLYFRSPIELYIKTTKGEYLPYSNPSGQQSCREQAWSAAVALDLLSA